jgi:glycoprotease/Kae1 family metallohydrolase
MKVFGIESTAHTFGLGVVDENYNILEDLRITYKPREGIVPIEAAKFHEKNASKLLEKVDFSKIDLIGVANGPGLPPCLRFGVELAKKISEKIKKPLVGVNHCQAHIEIGKILCKVKDPIILYISGGNTQVIYYNQGYKILGETQDIGLGNALDKLGRAIGLEFPAGPKIEKLAKKGKFVMLPYYVKGMDLNFSGILTEAIRKIKKGGKVEDILYSFQEVCFSMLAEVCERAMAATEKKELLLVGGVAQNRRLQEILELMCKDRKAKLFVVPKEYAGDNGVMIAMCTLKNWKENRISKPEVNPNWRIDTI